MTNSRCWPRSICCSRRPAPERSRPTDGSSACSAPSSRREQPVGNCRRSPPVPVPLRRGCPRRGRRTRPRTTGRRRSSRRCRRDRERSRGWHELVDRRDDRRRAIAERRRAGEPRQLLRPLRRSHRRRQPRPRHLGSNAAAIARSLACRSSVPGARTSRFWGTRRWHRGRREAADRITRDNRRVGQCLASRPLRRGFRS